MDKGDFLQFEENGFAEALAQGLKDKKNEKTLATIAMIIFHFCA
jgi:hypothetical protein